MGLRPGRFRAALGALVLVAAVVSGPSASAWASPADGITWTSRTSAADNNWRSVTYGNGLFVAVAISGTLNRVMTSPDGITWTTRTTPNDNWWHDVTYANGLFVAVAVSGTGNRVMTNGTFDTTAPGAPSITTGPADSSTTPDTGASFTFDTAGAASHECRLDTPAGTGTWAPCTSPHTYSSLTPGTHTFHVRAIDQAGNTGASTTRTFTTNPAAITPAPAPRACTSRRTLRVRLDRHARRVQVTVLKGGTPVREQTITSPKPIGLISLVGLAKGTYHVRLTTTTAHGTTTRTTRTYVARTCRAGRKVHDKNRVAPAR
jgi:hypothetical protein